jgi:hypothetical protein
MPKPFPWPAAVPANALDALQGDTLSSFSGRVLWIAAAPGRIQPSVPLLWDTETLQLRSAITADHNESTPTTLLAVCTHGSHDPCCGRRGNELVSRLSKISNSSTVFRTSHLGGDRFAANALLLPEGYLLGRLDSVADKELMQLVEDRMLPLGCIRGRLGYSPAEAAAESFFRERTGIRQAKSFINVRIVSIDGADQERTWKVRVSSEKTHLNLQLRLCKLRASKINYTCMSGKKEAISSWHIEEGD